MSPNPSSPRTFFSSWTQEKQNVGNCKTVKLVRVPFTRICTVRGCVSDAWCWHRRHANSEDEASRGAGHIKCPHLTAWECDSQARQKFQGHCTACGKAHFRVHLTQPCVLDLSKSCRHEDSYAFIRMEESKEQREAERRRVWNSKKTSLVRLLVPPPPPSVRSAQHF